MLWLSLRGSTFSCTAWSDRAGSGQATSTFPRDTDALASVLGPLHSVSMLRGLWHGRTGFSQVLAALAFIAIAVRALVPSGYMVGPSEDGRILPIVLCSGHEAFLDLTTGQLVEGGAPTEDGGPSKQTSAPCVFAVSAHFAAPAPITEPALAQVYGDEAPLIRPVSVPGRGLAAPPPWATGPPLTA